MNILVIYENENLHKLIKQQKFIQIDHSISYKQSKIETKGT